MERSPATALFAELFDLTEFKSLLTDGSNLLAIQLLTHNKSAQSALVVPELRAVIEMTLSSESALNIPTEMVHYGVSKTAVQGLSRGLAKVLAGTGVTVNTILPGPTRTEGAITMMADLAAKRGVTSLEMEALFLKENRPSTLLHRFASPEEVANICVYAASPQASATTGSSLLVEGGIVESIA